MEFVTTESKSGAVLALYNEGHTQRAIALKLNLPKSTVAYIIKKHNDTGALCRLPGSGRPRSLDESDILFIVDEVCKNPKTSALKLSVMLSEKNGKTFSHQTVRNYLHANNLFGRVACKKPLISSKNMKIRFETAKEWAMWPQKKWNNVLFSDESKFNLFNSDGRTIVWRKPGERLSLKNLVPTVKHGGGSLMVWGSMSATGVGELVFIEGIMDSVRYVRILAESLDASAEKAGISNGFVFQQDNDPKHKSKYTMKYFEENDIKLLNHPAQSPDLNPIENLWGYIELELKKRVIKNLRELKAAIQEIWDNIDPQFCRRLVNSMPKRVSEVIRAKGGPINY